MFYRIYAATAAALALFLTAGTGSLTADEKKHDRTEALAAKLGLNDQQKEDIRKISTAFEAKMEPVELQLWNSHREARAEFRKLLTDDQRTKLPEVIKEESARDLQPVAAKLGLNDEQRAQVGKTMANFGKKFHELAEQNPDDSRKQFGELKSEFCAAVCKDLNEVQRIRLPQVLRAEFHHMMNTNVQNEHVKALEAKLDLSVEQKSQIQKILAQCNERIEKPVTQMTEMCREENAAIDKILTSEQRGKLEEIMKSSGRDGDK